MAPPPPSHSSPYSGSISSNDALDMHLGFRTPDFPDSPLSYPPLPDQNSFMYPDPSSCHSEFFPPHSAPIARSTPPRSMQPHDLQTQTRRSVPPRNAVRTVSSYRHPSLSPTQPVPAVNLALSPPIRVSGFKRDPGTPQDHGKDVLEQRYALGEDSDVLAARSCFLDAPRTTSVREDAPVVQQMCVVHSTTYPDSSYGCVASGCVVSLGAGRSRSRSSEYGPLRLSFIHSWIRVIVDTSKYVSIYLFYVHWREHEERETRGTVSYGA